MKKKNYLQIEMKSKYDVFRNCKSFISMYRGLEKVKLKLIDTRSRSSRRITIFFFRQSFRIDQHYQR